MSEADPNADDNWGEEKPTRMKRAINAALVITAILALCLIWRWPVVLAFTIAKGRVERASMEPMEIILAVAPSDRKKNSIDLPDSSFARLQIPRKFIIPGYDYNNTYMSAVFIRISPDTLGSDIIKTLYPTQDLDGISFSLWGSYTAHRSMYAAIDRFKKRAISIHRDRMFEWLITSDLIYDPEHPDLDQVPAYYFLIPLVSENAKDTYIQCPFKDNGSYCSLKYEFDEKITISALINRTDLYYWLSLRESTRQFVAKYYVTSRP